LQAPSQPEPVRTPTFRLAPDIDALQDIKNRVTASLLRYTNNSFSFFRNHHQDRARVVIDAVQNAKDGGQINNILASQRDLFDDRVTPESLETLHRRSNFWLEVGKKNYAKELENRKKRGFYAAITDALAVMPKK